MNLRTIFLTAALSLGAGSLQAQGEEPSRPATSSALKLQHLRAIEQVKAEAVTSLAENAREDLLAIAAEQKNLAKELRVMTRAQRAEVRARLKAEREEYKQERAEYRDALKDAEKDLREQQRKLKAELREDSQPDRGRDRD